MMNDRINAALILASVAGLGMAAQAMPAPRKGSSRNYTDADIERAFARNAPPNPGPDAAMRAEVDRLVGRLGNEGTTCCKTSARN